MTIAFVDRPSVALRWKIEDAVPGLDVLLSHIRGQLQFYFPLFPVITVADPKDLMATPAKVSFDGTDACLRLCVTPETRFVPDFLPKTDVLE